MYNAPFFDWEPTALLICVSEYHRMLCFFPSIFEVFMHFEYRIRSNISHKTIRKTVTFRINKLMISAHIARQALWFGLFVAIRALLVDNLFPWCLG